MKSLADVFAVFNAMRAEGVIAEYAIGGALAALFHSEATRTYDVVVFVVPAAPAANLISLSALYDWCRGRGFEARGEHVVIHGVPVQFLSADGGIEREAADAASEVEYQGVNVRVMTPEYLVVLFLRAGGARRRERAGALLDLDGIDRQRLDEILARHGLAGLLPNEG